MGTWNVRNLCRFCSLTEAARELARCKLDLVRVEDVRWDKGVTASAGIIIFLWKKKRKSSIGNKIFVHHKTVSTVKGVEFVAIG